MQHPPTERASQGFGLSNMDWLRYGASTYTMTIELQLDDG